MSGRRVRGFFVGLGGEPVPGPSHVLHDLAMPLGLGVSRQAAAFLRKSPVFRCCFHAGITGRSTGPFLMHGGHAGGTVSPATVNRLSVRDLWGGKAKTPPSGRGGVLRPAATPGEETRLRVRPSNSLARSKVRPRVTEFHLKSLSQGCR